MVPRILIVDDENDFIELLQYKLAGHGYDLIVANDGIRACEPGAADEAGPDPARHPAARS